MEVIYLGAGCFWCVEAVFQRLIGVSEVVSGYMGGSVKNPAYREVCNGTTGHAEVIKVVFDESQITIEDILTVFWATHDPTTLNRQGADRGTQYRSAIFYTSEAQMEVAKQSKSDCATQLWSDPIVTEITAASVFYAAEAYHQNYFNQNSQQSYCSIVINPKLKKFREHFSHLIEK